MNVGGRRGVSPIVAELLLIAITVGLGSTVFLIGSTTISGYTTGFSLLFGENASAAQEIFVVEYAQFVTGSPNSTVITIRNVGFIPAEVASVSLFNRTDVDAGLATSGTFTLTTTPPITVPASSACPYCSASASAVAIPVQAFCQIQVQFNWSSGTTYNLVISTQRGNTLVVQEIA